MANQPNWLLGVGSINKPAQQKVRKPGTNWIIENNLAQSGVGQQGQDPNMPQTVKYPDGSIETQSPDAINPLGFAVDVAPDKGPTQSEAFGRFLDKFSKQRKIPNILSGISALSFGLAGAGTTDPAQSMRYHQMAQEQLKPFEEQQKLRTQYDMMKAGLGAEKDADVREYEYYVQQAAAQGKKPVDFMTYRIMTKTQYPNPWERSMYQKILTSMNEE